MYQPIARPLIFLFLFGPAAFAQLEYGAIVGSVTDVSSLLVSGAT